MKTYYLAAAEVITDGKSVHWYCSMDRTPTTVESEAKIFTDSTKALATAQRLARLYEGPARPYVKTIGVK